MTFETLCENSALIDNMCYNLGKIINKRGICNERTEIFKNDDRNSKA